MQSTQRLFSISTFSERVTWYFSSTSIFSHVCSFLFSFVLLFLELRIVTTTKCEKLPKIFSKNRKFVRPWSFLFPSWDILHLYRSVSSLCSLVYYILCFNQCSLPRRNTSSWFYLEADLRIRRNLQLVDQWSMLFRIQRYSETSQQTPFFWKPMTSSKYIYILTSNYVCF